MFTKRTIYWKFVKLIFFILMQPHVSKRRDLESSIGVKTDKLTSVLWNMKPLSPNECIA